MNNKYAMIIDGDNVLSCSLPSPLVCPNCKNEFWVIYGSDDIVKLSQKCKCKNQMPSKPTKDNFEYDDGYGTEPTDLETNEGATDMIKPDDTFECPPKRDTEPSAAEPKHKPFNEMW